MQLTNEVQHKERQNAVMWRVQSRSRWMKLGDVPSSYFFHLVMVKCARETIKILELPKGVQLRMKGRFFKRLADSIKRCMLKIHRWNKITRLDTRFFLSLIIVLVRRTTVS